VILVTGSTGFLGKSVVRNLKNKNLEFLTTSLSSGIDLRNYNEVKKIFETCKPAHVINCAAYVGGIQFGYKHSAELFKNNMLMTINILEACKEFDVVRLVNPISNCAYPAKATLFKEDEFWDGPLHESVQVYGYARKASWVGAWAYQKQYDLDVINLILSNMYGPHDHFEEERSHALGALIMKIVNAHRCGVDEVVVWGTGLPVREWLHVDDGAEALVRSLDIDKYSDPINVGVGKGISILDMAQLIKNHVGYKGELKLDPSKPDGAPYKTVDGTRGAQLLSWAPTTPFHIGIKETIDWYIKNEKY
jgi:GDP-L-fucose synthase